MEQTQQRIIFESQLLERSVTRTLDSVESAMVSLDMLFAQQADVAVSTLPAERLRQRVDEMIHLAPHIRQVIVTEGTRVLVDSAARGEGQEIDAQRLGLDFNSSSMSGQSGLRIISRLNQQFLPLIDQQETQSTHRVVVTGLRSGFHSLTGEPYWILVALSPEYLTGYFLHDRPPQTTQRAVSLLSFDGDRIVSMLPETSDLPAVSEFLKSGQSQ
ncbi:hypothetical protein LH51_06585, partial [Nitrincola sp. A-D6]